MWSRKRVSCQNPHTIKYFYLVLIAVGLAVSGGEAADRSELTREPGVMVATRYMGEAKGLGRIAHGGSARALAAGDF